ncbi:MAG: hypothetical protein HKN76_14440 [Saprospiraceae bacterium]|nr:hypothetical protein [Saprospiraceae bacterium]
MKAAIICPLGTDCSGTVLGETQLPQGTRLQQRIKAMGRTAEQGFSRY